MVFKELTEKTLDIRDVYEEYKKDNESRTQVQHRKSKKESQKAYFLAV